MGRRGRAQGMRTSDSVRERAMAISELVSRPSVPMGVMNRCRFGVKRKGTASALTNSGLFGTMAAHGGCQRESGLSGKAVHTGKHVGCVNLACRARDVDPRRHARPHTHDVGRENEGRHLQRHLLADVPQLARACHGLDHVLQRVTRWESVRHTKRGRKPKADLFENVVRHHLVRDLLRDLQPAVPKLRSLKYMTQVSVCGLKQTREANEVPRAVVPRDGAP